MLPDSRSISLDVIWRENKFRYPSPVEAGNDALTLRNFTKTKKPETEPREPPAKGKVEGTTPLTKKFGDTSAEIILRHFYRFELRICCCCTPAG